MLHPSLRTRAYHNLRIFLICVGIFRMDASSHHTCYIIRFDYLNKKTLKMPSASGLLKIICAACLWSRFCNLRYSKGPKWKQFYYDHQKYWFLLIERWIIDFSVSTVCQIYPVFFLLHCWKFWIRRIVQYLLYIDILKNTHNRPTVRENRFLQSFARPPLFHIVNIRLVSFWSLFHI